LRRRPVYPRPHPVLCTSPAFAIRFLADRMRRSVDEALKQQGFLWSEYAVLTVVCEVPGIPQTTLADRAVIDRTRVSEALGHLEEHELVTREARGARRRLVYPTETGHACRAELDNRVGQAERAALLPLDPRERARLTAHVQKLMPPDRGIFG
jgi:DNA-binding MarR family transcriptional regulator